MPLALNGEVPLVIFGSDHRALTINPTTGLLTPAQAAAESGDYDSLFPSDARLLVSDYWSITEQSPTRLRFLRGITNGNAFQHCSPGSRVGFYTNAQVVRFRLYWNGLVTRDDVQNFVGGVLVDDVLEQTFTNAFGASGTGEAWETVDFGSASTTARKVELIWPYGDGMDLLEVQVSRGAAVIAAPARPTTKLVVAGDSITHGFNASNIFTSWAWQLAVAKGYQLINVANGSELVVAANANVLSETGAQHVIYAIGYNNFVSQTATATFQASLEGWLANARAELPDARLYVSSMLYTPNTNTITPAQYRTATAAAVTAFGDGNTEYVNGLSLMTNSSDRLADTIHPNDTGAAEVATAWASIID
jgi:lysophospholipase L1-like esterase